MGDAHVSIAGIAARRAHMLEHALQENGLGPLRETARWTANFGNLGIVLGIVWNMTEKPGTGGAIAAVAVAYAVAALVSWQLTRAPAVEAAAASETA